MKILIAGDFCPRFRVEEKFERNDYSSVLADVKDIISKVDYSIVNFECPVVKDCVNPITKLGPNLSCSIQGMEAIKWAGFNCVTLANNHFYDYGEDGVTQTLFAVESLGIDYVGGGKNIREASNILYKKISGRILAVINCCENEFSIASEFNAGSNPLNPISQYYAIQEARRNSDYVLVIVHGGHEHYQLPSLRMKETYRFFIDSGADAIVNHHQHCYSGYEVYKGKPIIYGLGNFLFDDPSRINTMWNEGYLVVIDFISDNPSFSIRPYIQCSNEPKIKLLSPGAFDDNLNKLNDIISDNNALRSELSRYYDSQSSNYSRIFEPIDNRYYLIAKNKGWLPSLIGKKRKITATNFVCCESHRDKLIHWLTKKNNH